MLVALTLVASLSSMLVRRHATSELDLEAFVLTCTTWLALLGMLATLLAMFGRFGAVSIGAGAIAGTLVAWPWNIARPSRFRALFRTRRHALTAVPWGRTAAVVGLLLLGLALRWPPADHALAGRDQGTYTLRAQHTLRTGRLHATDELLAAAGSEAGLRSGPADPSGLYHRNGEPWLRDRYEASYRPGFYLADLDTGDVHPQFFHLHPMLMATAGLVIGPAEVAAVGLVHAALCLLGLWAVGRRLWPRGPWAGLATGLWAIAPLAIWVQRTPLSEGPAVVMMVGGLLGVLRARAHEPAALSTAGFLLGALAWIRGNGWLAAPIILAASWLVPSRERVARRASWVYAATFGAAVLVHAPTTFPYLHDELLRQLPLPQALTPGVLIAVTMAGLLAWLVIDRLGPLRRIETSERGARMWAWLFGAGPWVLALGLVVSVALHLGWRDEPPTKPWSRLDPVVPLLGVPVLITAGLGLGFVLRRWPRRPDAATAWLLGLGGIVVATVALYAQRNLPQLSLYYYGRYLVPELLPAVLLLAVEGGRCLHQAFVGPHPSRRRRWLVGIATLMGVLGLSWSTAGVLVVHPVTRLPEFEGAGRVVDHLAARIPEGAVVIAGGEGWHHGHTFNQVGGALAFRHGIAVLPYHTREAAYASLHELLVARPQATGQAPPPVFLLLNEATKDRARPLPPGVEPGPKPRLAALDDLLPPPFVARRIELVEMFLDRLSPVDDGPPTRVTRDGLRMALVQVEVDPERWPEVERWLIDVRDRAWHPEGPPGLALDGGAPDGGAPCMGPEPLALELPETGGAGRGPVSVVLVATPGTAAENHRWRVEIDGFEVALDPPHMTPRHRDTLGPIGLTHRPRSLVVRGLEAPVADARCPHGGLAELRVLGPERSMLASARTSAVTFAPTRDLGHPVAPVAWVSGRGLSRYRRGISPELALEGLSLRLEPGVPLRFPAAALPDEGRSPLDVVLTLTRTALGPEARLWVTLDGQTLPPIDPPDERVGSWQSPPSTWAPGTSTAEVTVELRDAGPGEHVLLRDIGLFSHAPPREGRLSLQ